MEVVLHLLCFSNMQRMEEFYVDASGWLSESSRSRVIHKFWAEDRIGIGMEVAAV